jgi:hypothetical protein
MTTFPATRPGCSPATRAWIAGLLCLSLAGTPVVAQNAGPALNPDHPDRYVVQKGDTLWGISSLFLRDPWLWPEIWYVNPQVANPHLIYPGDVLSLVYVGGKPQIRLDRDSGTAATGTGRLSPRIREEGFGDAIDTIPTAAISAFLGRGTVLQRKEINQLPYVVSLRDGVLTGAAGQDAYVRGKLGDINSVYSVVHVGERLVDPDNGRVLGYEGIYVGEGTIRRGGNPATLFMNETAREARRGDRLVPVAQDLPLQFLPRAPERQVDGRIIRVVDGMTTFGAYQVVVLNRGTRHGLEPGHVLTVSHAGERVRDMIEPGAFGRKVQLPDEEVGTVMVFRTYDGVSYALVMRSSAPMHALDKVANPS